MRSSACEPYGMGISLWSRYVRASCTHPRTSMTRPTGGTEGCTSRTNGSANSSAMERLGASMMRGA